MSLPPGFLDELRTRTSIAQVVGRKVIWDNRKSNQAKGDMWAPCPFHQEKSASFHVDDRKGFYYCFGCQAKGDMFKFVQETENVGFMEAVQILAGEAGMQMPARDPQAQEKADKATQLAKVTEAAVQHFRLQLKTQAASDARAYLEGRGMDQATLDRFEIGFAPNGRNSTHQALVDKGFAVDDITAANVSTKPDDGGAPYDAFRDRIIFPIRDARGRCLGFGGRAMDPNARAKYLNSRETPLFDKGRALYNHGPAREAAGKGQPLIVAEGYMDVIALVGAGFEAAVAPLGTAVTEDQLRLMWRITDEPIIALDGDKAGLRAAMRLVDLAMPLLEGGKSLRFVILPEGQDPDDLIRAQGPGAMQALLDKAEPMVTLLWRRETEGQVFDSPERRSALDGRLRQALQRIGDPGLRRHYGDAISELRRALFRPQQKPWQPGKRGPWKGRGFAEAQAPLAATRARVGALSGETLRTGLIVATCIRFPDLIDVFEPQLDRMNPRDPDHARLTAHLLRTQNREAATLLDEINASPLAPALESLLRLSHLAITPFLIGAGDRARAEDCLEEEFARLTAARAIEDEMVEASQDVEAAPDEGDPALAYRMKEALRGKHAAQSPKGEDNAEQFGETSEARSAFHQLLSTAGQGKKLRK
ncbi:DNA primase [Jannaschia sp. CCS1]|uniref:DNA primase n=1 Tax=Jannaschia sp. (strain CCS1) TaxID=290400 RepID=UPI000053A68B|nr:DNA primase [Jannaschia sp. CCS1]ABD56366.1 DNA primase [Jannaschia sp. CCS1]